MGLLDDDCVVANFPNFGGKNPRIWVEKFNQLFSMNSTPEDQRVNLVEPYMEGRAALWYPMFRLIFKSASWEDFTEILVSRFGEDEVFEEWSYPVSSEYEFVQVWTAQKFEESIEDYPTPVSGNEFGAAVTDDLDDQRVRGDSLQLPEYFLQAFSSEAAQTQNLGKSSEVKHLTNSDVLEDFDYSVVKIKNHVCFDPGIHEECYENSCGDVTDGEERFKHPVYGHFGSGVVRSITVELMKCDDMVELQNEKLCILGESMYDIENSLATVDESVGSSGFLGDVKIVEGILTESHAQKYDSVLNEFTAEIFVSIQMCHADDLGMNDSDSECSGLSAKVSEDGMDLVEANVDCNEVVETTLCFDPGIKSCYGSTLRVTKLKGNGRIWRTKDDIVDLDSDLISFSVVNWFHKIESVKVNDAISKASFKLEKDSDEWSFIEQIKHHVSFFCFDPGILVKILGYFESGFKLKMMRNRETCRRNMVCCRLLLDGVTDEATKPTETDFGDSCDRKNQKIEMLLIPQEIRKKFLVEWKRRAASCVNDQDSSGDQQITRPLLKFLSFEQEYKMAESLVRNQSSCELQITDSAQNMPRTCIDVHLEKNNELKLEVWEQASKFAQVQWKWKAAATHYQKNACQVHDFSVHHPPYFEAQELLVAKAECWLFLEAVGLELIDEKLVYAISEHKHSCDLHESDYSKGSSNGGTQDTNCSTCELKEGGLPGSMVCVGITLDGDQMSTSLDFKFKENGISNVKVENGSKLEIEKGNKLDILQKCYTSLWKLASFTGFLEFTTTAAIMANAHSSAILFFKVVPTRVLLIAWKWLVLGFIFWKESGSS